MSGLRDHAWMHPVITTTILVVDDEELIVDMAKTILNTLGHEVLTARNGLEAINIYENEKENIDLVLLDAIMPVMGGSAAIDRLKTMNPDIKIILASGYGLDDEIEAIMKKGCLAFISKPFRVKELSNKIREALELTPAISR
jgi:CheY-like chemotaxis protein